MKMENLTFFLETNVLSKIYAGVVEITNNDNDNIN